MLEYNDIHRTFTLQSNSFSRLTLNTADISLGARYYSTNETSQTNHANLTLVSNII